MGGGVLGWSDGRVCVWAAVCACGGGDVAAAGGWMSERGLFTA